MSAEPMVVLDRICKRWRDEVVLDDVDLTLGPGQLAWLSGSNGVGKTTLLRITSGLILPDAGTVTFGGITALANPSRFYRRLAFLSAGDRGLYARLTARQNLELAAGLALVARRDSPTTISRALRRFELDDLAGRRVDRMSMGQRQRVRLAMTFLHDPDLVLLDEPRTSLDDLGIELLAAALDELTSRGGTAIWCSPRGDDAVLAGADAYVLENGKVRPA